MVIKIKNRKQRVKNLVEKISSLDPEIISSLKEGMAGDAIEWVEKSVTSATTLADIPDEFLKYTEPAAKIFSIFLAAWVLRLKNTNLKSATLNQYGKALNVLEDAIAIETLNRATAAKDCPVEGIPLLNLF